MLLVFAGVLPLLAFSLGSQYLQYRRSVAATGQQALELARSLCFAMDEELEIRVVALQVLTLSRTLRSDDITGGAGAGGGDGIRALSRLERAAAARGRPAGDDTMPAAVGATAGTAKPRIAPRSLCDRQACGCRSLFEGAVTGQPTLAIDVPVKREGWQRQLCAVAQSAARSIRRRDPRPALPEGRVVTVFDRNNMVVARVPNSERYVGQPATAAFMPTLTGEREGHCRRDLARRRPDRGRLQPFRPLRLGGGDRRAAGGTGGARVPRRRVDPCGRARAADRRHRARARDRTADHRPDPRRCAASPPAPIPTCCCGRPRPACAKPTRWCRRCAPRRKTAG